MMDYYTLKQTLENGIVTVTFTKADGSLREMRCTLQPQYLPPQLLQEAPSRSVNMNTMAVWDVEANGWRSFRIDSIQSIG